MQKIIVEAAIAKRAYWIEEIRKLSGCFGSDSERVESELSQEIKKEGTSVLIDHLRLCGDIPESYAHDSTEEKLYSKYTDSILCESYKAIGLRSIVLKDRSDAADVEAFGKNGLSFVADAKSFRLSRTAKNQKDFKVAAMHGWKRGKPFAMVVCPIYQMPTKASQIYEQAITRDICLFTYSHLAMLVAYSLIDGQEKAEALIHDIFRVVSTINPSKDAVSYWMSINKTILNFSENMRELWSIEKRAAIESIAAAKEESLCYLAREREKIMSMSHDEALNELIKVYKIESKIRIINSVTHNSVLTYGEK